MIFYYKTYAQIAVIDFMDCIRIQQPQQQQHMYTYAFVQYIILNHC